MFNQSYLEMLKSLLELDFKFLYPWKADSDETKLSKLFHARVASILVLTLIMVSFIIFGWETLPFTTIVENIGMALAMIRSFGYDVLAKKFYREYKKQVDKMFEDRKTFPLDPKEQTLTESYCRTEFRMSVAHHLNCYCFVFVFLHAITFFLPNAYHLPFNCHIIFLPPDGFLFAWELNYLVITVTITMTALSSASFICIPFLLMDHSCWLLDMALLTAENVNDNLRPDEDIRNIERVSKTNENLKKFAERCETFVEWQNEVQELLSWYFNLEFQVQSLILCLSIYVLSFAGGILVLVFIFCAVQILFLCWMGTRVTAKIDQLSYEISKNWYLMMPSQRKPAQMILHWTQNMPGFSGLFKDVSLETCKSIFEASYSFYAFLRSTNGN